MHLFLHPGIHADKTTVPYVQPQKMEKQAASQPTNPIQTQPDWTKHKQQTEPKCVTCENSHKSFFLSLHTVHIHASFSQIKRNYVIWLMFKIYKVRSCLTVLLFIFGSSRFKKMLYLFKCFWQETNILVCKHIYIYVHIYIHTCILNYTYSYAYSYIIFCDFACSASLFEEKYFKTNSGHFHMFNTRDFFKSTK